MNEIGTASTKPIGLIFNGVWSQYALAVAPKYRNFYEPLYIHGLDDVQLKKYQALVIPFQSHRTALISLKNAFYGFLADGGKISVFGDSASWLDHASWEDRPVNNYWWLEDPGHPPITQTDFDHPVYQGLTPRQAGWHHHGVYAQVPEDSEIIQRNASGEVISWQTHRYGGVLLASTLDPIVEHGIQQIRHLDAYVDNLTLWLCGIKPTGRFEVDPADFGLTAFPSQSAEYFR